MPICYELAEILRASFMKFYSLVFMLVCILSCTKIQTLSTKIGGDSSLINVFLSIEKQTQVPAELLMAMSYHETRFKTIEPTGPYFWQIPQIHGRFGVMGLSGNQLRQSILITMSQTEQNIYHAAILLRSNLDNTARIPTKEQWIDAAVKTTNYESYEAKKLYRDNLKTYVENGFYGFDDSGHILFVLPERDEHVFEHQKNDNVSMIQPDFNKAVFIPASSKNYLLQYKETNPKTVIVIHSTEGSYTSAIHWFQNPNAETSAHYLVNSNGQIYQFVKNADIAWHVGVDNFYTIGIEHEGRLAYPETWFSKNMYRASAQLVRHLAKELKIPIDRHHILGHYEICSKKDLLCADSYQFDQCHFDPGCGWDWEYYFELLQDDEALSRKGTLSGVLYYYQHPQRVVANISVEITHVESNTTQVVSSDLHGFWSSEVLEGRYQVRIKNAKTDEFFERVKVSENKETTLFIELPSSFQRP